MTTFPFPPGPRGGVPAEYAELAATQPVARVPLADGTHIWLVTRYADVSRVLTDPVFSRRRAAALPGVGLGRSQGNGIIDLDGPEHDRLRAPIAAAFGPSRVSRWRGRIAAILAEELGNLERTVPPSGVADLVADYSAPLAGRVTCEFLGFPADEWRQLAADVELQLVAQDHPRGDVERAQLRVEETISALLRERRERPADDVASTLLAAGDGAGPGQVPGTGTALDDGERLGLLQGLIVSGYIGVRSLLARHLFAVLSAPPLLGRLLHDPAAVPAAVEELLRCYPSSNDGLLRVATRDVELGGTRIKDGDAVLPLVSAACRDQEYFPDPDQVDIDRVADRSLSFGAGPHACPADDLARTMLAAGIGGLLARFPEVRLAVPADDVQHTSDLLPLGVRSLPVRLGEPAASVILPTPAKGDGAV
jgi:cytochrome P450